MADSKSDNILFLDVEQAKEVTDDDFEFFQELLVDLFDEEDKFRNDIEASLSSATAVTIKNAERAYHSVKGAASTLGFAKLADIAKVGEFAYKAWLEHLESKEDVVELEYNKGEPKSKFVIADIIASKEDYLKEFNAGYEAVHAVADKIKAAESFDQLDFV
jgi:HPt (histidine-containing phosphotransfer) domain-containing protein